MVTPELKEYIRGEFAKGRIREDIEKSLLANGWTAIDCSDAFKAVAIAQSFVGGPVMKKSNFSRLWKTLLVLVVLVVVGFTIWWFLRAPIFELWSNYIGTRNLANDTRVNTENTTPQNVVNSYQGKECGNVTISELRSPEEYENNEVLNCIGQSARSCENSRAVLDNRPFPPVFEVVKEQDICIFKLSYPVDNTLSDVNGEKLANQYISCPIDVVRVIGKDSAGAITLGMPNEEILSQYAREIYTYGTRSVFVENNLDQSKIENKGCKGPYIKSFIDSQKKFNPSI